MYIRIYFYNGDVVYTHIQTISQPLLLTVAKPPADLMGSTIYASINERSRVIYLSENKARFCIRKHQIPIHGQKD